MIQNSLFENGDRYFIECIVTIVDEGVGAPQLDSNSSKRRCAADHTRNTSDIQSRVVLQNYHIFSYSKEAGVNIYNRAEDGVV
jgi:hypothetical protein